MENTIHRVRDVTFGEDHSSVRTGSGPQVMAAPRNTAVNVSPLAGHTNIAAAQRHYSWEPATAIPDHQRSMIHTHRRKSKPS